MIFLCASMIIFFYKIGQIDYATLVADTQVLSVNPVPDAFRRAISSPDLEEKYRLIKQAMAEHPGDFTKLNQDKIHLYANAAGSAAIGVLNESCLAMDEEMRLFVGDSLDQLIEYLLANIAPRCRNTEFVLTFNNAAAYVPKSRVSRYLYTPELFGFGSTNEAILIKVHKYFDELSPANPTGSLPPIRKLYRRLSDQYDEIVNKRATGFFLKILTVKHEELNATQIDVLLLKI